MTQEPDTIQMICSPELNLKSNELVQLKRKGRGQEKAGMGLPSQIPVEAVVVPPGTAETWNGHQPWKTTESPATGAACQNKAWSKA